MASIDFKNKFNSKSKIIQLIKAVRIPDCLLVVLAGFIGFKYSLVPVNIFVLITLFFVIASTMLQNDWRDRFHDLKKGKKFAYDKPKLFLYWLVFFWIICVVLILLVFLQNPFSAGLLLLMAFVGAIYSETRNISLLPVSLVTLTVASCTLLPLTLGASFITIFPLFFSVGFIMFGRETLHDIADLKADRGYKKTVPIVFSDRFARIVSTISLVVGCGFAIMVSYISFIGVIFILWGLIDVMNDTLLIRVRKRIDIGLALLAIGLAIG